MNSKKGVSNEYRGSYVDPRLINYIAMWASPRYAVYVGKIMDLINVRNQIEKKILEQENEDQEFGNASYNTAN